MLFAFETIELRSLCESESAAKEALGDADAVQLLAALADLRAAANLGELPGGIVDIYPADASLRALSSGQYRLIFAPRLALAGSDDLLAVENVTRIKFLRIERHV